MAAEWLDRLSVLRSMALVLLLAPTLSAAQTQTERFDIDRFEIVGNTLLGDDEIEAALSPYTGDQRELADMQGAMEALRERYRSAGYSVVWVVAPEQDLDRGVVTLRVIEAQIGEVTIAGNQYFDEENIRAALPALTEGVPPRTADISANVLLSNENPTRQVDVVLRPGEIGGLVDATVDVMDVDPFKMFLTLDNTGNPQTGDFRIGFGAQHANLFNRDHVGTLTYVTSPEEPDRVSLYSGSYRLPLYSLGDSIDFIAAFSDVSTGTTQTVAGPLTFTGRGAVYSLRYNQLLRRRGEYSHRIVYGMDYRAFNNACALGDFGAAGCGPTAVDVTIRPITLAYSGKWERPGNISDFYVALSRNWPGIGNGNASDFDAARPSPTGGIGAPADYTIVRFGISTVHAFQSNWQLRLALNAQYTPDALIFGEKFGIAGSSAVRGFREREIVRDAGAVANIEFYTPSLAGRLIPGEGNLRALFFFDIAEAVDQPLAGEARRRVSISSIGAGLRWNIQRTLNLNFDLARVVSGGGVLQAGDLHGHISIYYGF